MYYAILDKIIRAELDKNQRIAFFPFGKIGMQAENILEKRYGRKAILIDNGLQKYNPKIVSLVNFSEMDSEDITIVLCTNKPELNMKLNQQIEDMKLKASVANIIQQSTNDIPKQTITQESGKKYCVLRRQADNCGLFSFFIIFLGGISYCIKNDLIPIVDMLTYDNMYQDGEKINSWELFFKQPMGVRLQDAVNAVYLDCNEITDYPNMSMDLLTNNKKIAYWRGICQKYIRFNEAAQQVIDHYMGMYMSNDKEKETMGVLCRGTDYTELKPFGHPVQPDVNDVIDKARKLMEKNRCKYVFLATEDKKIYDIFAAEFGEQLIVLDMERYENTGNNYLADIIKKQSDIYKRGMDYLVSIYILSKCKCLVAGRTSGSVGAMILSEGYDEVYLWNEGYYGVDA